jgi:outer membrane protein assembly factor BamB
VIVTAGASYVYAYDTDGSERWSKGPGGYSHSAPIVTRSHAVVAPEDEVQLLDTADGSVVERATVDWQPFASGVLSDQRLYYGTTEGLLVFERDPLEITGRISTSATIRTRPVVSETAIYVLDEAGQLTIIDCASLNTVDQLQLRLEGTITVDPMIAAGRLILFGDRSVAVYR